MRWSSGERWHPGECRRAEDRPGFTVVEVLVALVVLTVGVLALASTSALVARQLNASGQLSTAANLAQSRLERLASAGKCAEVASGAASSRGVEERWTVAAGAPVAAVTISLRIPPDPPLAILESSVRCR